jgi:hypothetical protein
MIPPPSRSTFNREFMPVSGAFGKELVMLLNPVFPPSSNPTPGLTRVNTSLESASLLAAN